MIVWTIAFYAPESRADARIGIAAATSSGDNHPDPVPFVIAPCSQALEVCLDGAGGTLSSGGWRIRRSVPSIALRFPNSFGVIVEAARGAMFIQDAFAGGFGASGPVTDRAVTVMHGPRRAHLIIDDNFSSVLHPI